MITVQIGTKYSCRSCGDHITALHSTPFGRLTICRVPRRCHRLLNCAASKVLHSSILLIMNSFLLDIPYVLLMFSACRTDDSGSGSVVIYNTAFILFSRELHRLAHNSKRQKLRELVSSIIYICMSLHFVRILRVWDTYTEHPQPP